MAITVAGRVEPPVRIDTSNPMTWVHSVGIASPKGVVVGFAHGNSTTDHVAAVKYGSLSLTRIQRNIDDTTEAGAAELWFVGSGVPTGGQTITASLNTGTTDDIHGFSWTLNANRDLLVITSSGLSLGTTAANPSRAYANPQSREVYGFGAFYSGLSSQTAILAGTGCTKVSSGELVGAYCSVFLQANSSTFGACTIAASAAADDVGFSAIFIGEVNLTTAQAVPAVAVTASTAFRKAGLQVQAPLVSASSISRASLTFRQAVAGVIETVSDVRAYLLDFVETTISKWNIPFIAGGRLGVPISAPVGPQTYLQSLTAMEITSSSFVRGISGTISAASIISASFQRGFNNSIMAVDQLVAVVTAPTTFARSVAAQAVEAASLQKLIGKIQSATVSTAAYIAKAIGATLQAKSIVTAALTTARAVVSNIAAEDIFTAAITASRGLVSLAISAVDITVATLTEGAAYARTLVGALLTTPALNKLMSLFRTLASEGILQAAITQAGSVAQTFQRAVVATAELTAQIIKGIGLSASAKAITNATIVAGRGLVSRGLDYGASWVASASRMSEYMRSIDAGVVIVSAVDKLMSLYRTLGAESLMQAVMARTSSVAQMFQQAVGATTEMAAQLFKGIGIVQGAQAITSAVITGGRGLVSRVLNYGMIGAATITRMSQYVRSVSAETIVTPIIARLMSLYRTLGAEDIFQAVIGRASSVAQMFQQAVDASVLFTTVLVRGIGKLTQAQTIMSAVVIVGRGLVRRAIDSALIGLAALNRVATFPRMLAASSIVEPAINRLMSLYRQLAVGLVTANAIAKSMAARLVVDLIAFAALTKLSILDVIRRTISAALVTTSAITSRMYFLRSVAAEAILNPVVGRLMSLYRTLAGSAVFVAAINRAASVVQVFQQAIAAVVIFAPDRLLNIAYRVGVQVIFVASWTASAVMNRVLAGALLTTVNMSRVLTALRSLASETIVNAALNKLMSLYRTLAVAHQGIVSLVTHGLDPLDSAHMAIDRITGFIKGRGGLRRFFTTTRAQTTSTKGTAKHLFRSIRSPSVTSKTKSGRTGHKKPGDGDTDIE